MSAMAWLSTFSLRGGVVHYHQTGARVRVDGALVRDVLAWFTYYIPLRIHGAVRRLHRPGPKLMFVPVEPPPWYLIWNATAWIGARKAATAEDADAIVYFEDATWGHGVPDAVLRCINGACTDVSKSRVASLFEQVFQRQLEIDPISHVGAAVEKSELNGAHDGHIIACPGPRVAGRVYQRLIETGDDECVEDLRTPCVGGEPVAVFVKRRPKSRRFANYNTSVRLADPREVFSPPELQQIRVFLKEMKLDWGGLDILRERSAGEIYIVDVNKTDMPPLALPFGQKMQASRRLGRALDMLVRKRARGAAPDGGDPAFGLSSDGLRDAMTS